MSPSRSWIFSLSVSVLLRCPLACGNWPISLHYTLGTCARSRVLERPFPVCQIDDAATPKFPLVLRVKRLGVSASWCSWNIRFLASMYRRILSSKDKTVRMPSVPNFLFLLFLFSIIRCLKYSGEHPSRDINSGVPLPPVGRFPHNLDISETPYQAFRIYSRTVVSLPTCSRGRYGRLFRNSSIPSSRVSLAPPCEVPPLPGLALPLVKQVHTLRVREL